MKHSVRYIVAALVLSLAIAATAPFLEAQKESMPAAKVSINSATVEQLASLPGVGPATAGRIVEFRAKSGPFKRLEDLMAVKGIGEKSYQKLKDRITL